MAYAIVSDQLLNDANGGVVITAMPTEKTPQRQSERETKSKRRRRSRTRPGAADAGAACTTINPMGAPVERGAQWGRVGYYDEKVKAPLWTGMSCGTTTTTAVAVAASADAGDGDGVPEADTVSNAFEANSAAWQRWRQSRTARQRSNVPKG